MSPMLMTTTGTTSEAAFEDAFPRAMSPQNGIDLVCVSV